MTKPLESSFKPGYLRVSLQLSDDLINRDDFGDYKSADEKKNDYLTVSIRSRHSGMFVAGIYTIWWIPAKNMPE